MAANRSTDRYTKINVLAWVITAVLLVAKLAGTDMPWWVVAVPAIVAISLALFALLAVLFFMALQSFFGGR